MFAKIVLLLRNPYDALLSYANFVDGGHTGHPSTDSLIKGKKYVTLVVLKIWCTYIANEENLERVVMEKI